MAITKRLKDGIKEYMGLLEDYQTKHQAYQKAEEQRRTSKAKLNEKRQEILLELASCVSHTKGVPLERIVEVDGRMYALTEAPRDMGSDLPSYIKEILVER